MTGTLRVGCAQWTHPAWVGRHVRQGRELADYATWCTAVEGNTTFYAVPSPATVARWCDATDDSFRFVFKLPRQITHDRRLRHCGEDLAQFCDRIEPLGARLGPVTVQLPASFGPEDLGVLVDFLDRVPGAFEWAVEVRHAGFFDDGDEARRLNAALVERSVNRVMLDSRALFDGPCETDADREAFGRKPRLPVRAIATAGTPIVRFIGRSDVSANPGYWRRWCNKVAQWLAEDRDPIVFCHTPDNVESVDQARAFFDDVAALVDLAPLPSPVDPTDTPTLWGT